MVSRQPKSFRAQIFTEYQIFVPYSIKKKKTNQLRPSIVSLCFLEFFSCSISQSSHLSNLDQKCSKFQDPHNYPSGGNFQKEKFTGCKNHGFLTKIFENNAILRISFLTLPDLVYFSQKMAF